MREDGWEEMGWEGGEIGWEGIYGMDREDGMGGDGRGGGRNPSDREAAREGGYSVGRSARPNPLRSIHRLNLRSCSPLAPALKHARAPTHTCTHTHTHTCTHTYTNAQMRARARTHARTHIEVMLPL